MFIPPVPAQPSRTKRSDLQAGVKPWRLTIGHLLLWMGTTGAVLAFLQAFDETNAALVGLRQGDTSPRSSAWVLTRLLAPAYGAALAGSISVVLMLARGMPRERLAPGHWMLLVSGTWTLCLVVLAAGGGIVLEAGPRVTLAAGGIALIAVFAMTALAAWNEGIAGSESWYGALLMQAVVLGGMAAAALVAAIAGLERPLVFWMAVGMLLLAGSTILLAGITLFLAIAADLTENRPRDALHWIGVACLVLLGIHPLLFLLLQAVPR